LGADQQGRDVLSRVVYGSRVSLLVAVGVILSGGLVGVVSGLVAGYAGGMIDELIMRIVDIFYDIPALLVILVFVTVFGQSFALLVFLLSLFSWMQYARQVRAETLQLKTQDFVSYAQVSGASAPRVLAKHILPGVVSTIMIVASIQVGGVILMEATLSFLGVGVPPPTPSWGSMVAEGRNYLTNAWWIAFFPGIAIFLVVMACFFFADWARDRLDPSLRQADL
jgi:peptide/nickel transport system permease protein